MNYTFKYVYLGNTGVGKTAINRRFIHNTFDQSDSQATVGVSFSCKHIYLKKYNTTVKVHLWDTAGQERFKSILPMYYRGASVAFLVYDISQKNSFAEIKNYWIKNIQETAGNTLKVFVIGNKTDLSNIRQVPYEHGKQLAQEYGYDFYEISAKDECLTQFLYCITEQIYEQAQNIPTEEQKSYGIHTKNTIEINRQKRFYDTCCG